jgi:putative FmdB family regulatory protein
MPIYEYKCPQCGRVEERVVSSFMSDPMPVCVHHTVGTDGETHYPMARVPSAPAIKFKGPGFYVNDYKDK